jgi:hypothetical protein
MCNRAWRFRNDLDRLGEIGGVNHREAGDRKGDDMKAEFSVLTPAASGLRTYTGAPAAPINAPRSLISASWA